MVLPARRRATGQRNRDDRLQTYGKDGDERRLRSQKGQVYSRLWIMHVNSGMANYYFITVAQGHPGGSNPREGSRKERHARHFARKGGCPGRVVERGQGLSIFSTGHRIQPNT